MWLQPSPREGCDLHVVTTKPRGRVRPLFNFCGLQRHYPTNPKDCDDFSCLVSNCVWEEKP